MDLRHLAVSLFVLGDEKRTSFASTLRSRPNRVASTFPKHDLIIMCLVISCVASCDTAGDYNKSSNKEIVPWQSFMILDSGKPLLIATLRVSKSDPA